MQAGTTSLQTVLAAGPANEAPVACQDGRTSWKADGRDGQAATRATRGYVR